MAKDTWVGPRSRCGLASEVGALPAGMAELLLEDCRGLLAESRRSVKRRDALAYGSCVVAVEGLLDSAEIRTTMRSGRSLPTESTGRWEDAAEGWLAMLEGDVDRLDEARAGG
jgi:hypothetical protein